MLKTAIKKIIIVALVAVTAAGLYFGAYLPFKKSKSYIEVIHSGSAIRTFDDLKRRFDDVLTVSSLVSRDETISFFLDQLIEILRSKPPEEIGRQIVGYAEEIARPVVADPTNPELTKIVLKLGILYQNAWSVYQDAEYIRKAEEFYVRGLEISPNRPQFLYGLLDLYLLKGEREKAAEVKETIIRFWPEGVR